MKSIRPWLVIVISILVGVAAVYFAALWVREQAAVATSKVVVATRDLEVGTRLHPDMWRVVDWPTSAALKDPYDPGKLAELDGRVINTQILRGEPILKARLAAPGVTGGLSAVLAQGNRAITVKVNEIVGVAGFALPGNFVDVMVNTTDEANRTVSKIVLQRILVLAVAQDLSPGDKPRVVNAVTLEVTPQQAEQVDLARSVGTLSLVLRSQIDKGDTATAGARKTDLIALQPVTLPASAPAPAAAPSRDVPAPRAVARRTPATPPKPVTDAPPPAASAPAAPVKPATIEVIRGGKRTQETPAEAAP